MGQVVHNVNVEKPSTNSNRKIQISPNGTGPILEKVIVYNNSQLQPILNQQRIRKKQNQLFAELEIKNLDRQRKMDTAFQRPKISNYQQNYLDP